MQKKTTLVIVAVLVVGICAFYFIRNKYFAKPEKTEVISFLEHFTSDAIVGNPDTLLQYFATKQKDKQLTKLLGMLSNKTSSTGKEALFDVGIIPDFSDVKVVNTDIVEVKLPIIFNEKSISNNQKQTFLWLRLRKISSGKFKIIKIDAKGFYSDFLAYEVKFRNVDVPAAKLFAPITLAAFKKAGQLKGKYDSVLYFEHINNKTFFYVAKGHFRDRSIPLGESKDTDSYKIGLVSPDVREIIPVEYDVIHNIGGTIDSLIEVEKADKKGLYNIEGKIIVPAEYDEILPFANTAQNLAVLRKNTDYFYLKNDFSISGKVDGFKIVEALPNIKKYSDSYRLSDSTSVTLIEHNSREDNSSIVYPPSYLVGWDILPIEMDFPNPLRKATGNSDGEIEFEGSDYFQINFDYHKAEPTNWFENVVYSVYDDYVGGRGGLYQSKTLLFVDKRQNRVYGKSFNIYHGWGEGQASLSGRCNESQLRSIGDTLFEFKSTEDPDQELLNKQMITEAPFYHYMHIVDGKLVALPDKRVFSFTQYVKMDDSYLQGCFMVDDKQLDKMDRQILEYVKNEIYASYGYKFKNAAWAAIFADRFGTFDDKLLDNVDAYLSPIDKYNINFIAQKLKGVKIPPQSTLAAK